MKKRALIVGAHNPYPAVDGGIERLLVDYQAHIFSDYDVYYLVYESGDPAEMFHYGEPVRGKITSAKLLKMNFEFALFFNYNTDHRENDFIKSLREQIPSFCFNQDHPVRTISDECFRGIITHRSSRPHKDVLVIGGSFDSRVFYKNRSGEEFIICVARVTPGKGQLELASRYRERIYNRYKLPLYLVGGTYHLNFFRRLNKYIDNVSVHSTIDPEDPLAATNWWDSKKIAAICNRARMFVMPSPKESFCIALVEALACGTTCVVNGSYRGFKSQELRPYVYGHIDGKRGCTLDLVEEVLRREIRMDGSEWVKKYSLIEAKKAILQFFRERL